MSSSSIMQLNLEDAKRQLKKADDRRKSTMAEVEALLDKIEAVRADMYERSKDHAMKQSRLGELEQRCNEQMQRILQQISASQTAGRESWNSDTRLKAGAGVGEREKEPDVYNVERKTRQTPSRTQMAAPSPAAPFPAAAHPPSIPPGSGLNRVGVSSRGDDPRLYTPDSMNYTSPGLFCSPDSNPLLNRVGFTQQGAGQSDWEKLLKQSGIAASSSAPIPVGESARWTLVPHFNFNYYICANNFGLFELSVCQAHEMASQDMASRETASHQPSLMPSHQPALNMHPVHAGRVETSEYDPPPHSVTQFASHSDSVVEELERHELLRQELERQELLSLAVEHLPGDYSRDGAGGADAPRQQTGAHRDYSRDGAGGARGRARGGDIFGGEGGRGGQSWMLSDHDILNRLVVLNGTGLTGSELTEMTLEDLKEFEVGDGGSGAMPQHAIHTLPSHHTLRSRICQLQEQLGLLDS